MRNAAGEVVGHFQYGVEQREDGEDTVGDKQGRAESEPRDRLLGCERREQCERTGRGGGARKGSEICEWMDEWMRHRASPARISRPRSNPKVSKACWRFLLS